LGGLGYDGWRGVDRGGVLVMGPQPRQDRTMESKSRELVWMLASRRLGMLGEVKRAIVRQKIDKSKEMNAPNQPSSSPN
jgi:hypothetical protein